MGGGGTAGPGGLRHLPEPGGMLDQPAWTMTALEMLAAAIWGRRKEDEGGSSGG